MVHKLICVVLPGILPLFTECFILELDFTADAILAHIEANRRKLGI